MTPPIGARSPKAKAATRRIVDCTARTTTSRKARPASRDIREAGVTRIRSTTPARSSAIRLKPTNSAPKIPSCTSSPGVKTCHEFPAGKPWSPTIRLSRGPKSAR